MPTPPDPPRQRGEAACSGSGGDYIPVEELIMKRVFFSLLLAGFLWLPGSLARADGDQPEWLNRLKKARQVAARIEKMGGKIVRDETLFTRPVIAIDLAACRPSGEDLKSLAIFDKLEKLTLLGWDITDAKLEAVGRLTTLHRLHLRSTRITDAGLVHLRNLHELRELELTGNKITGSGFVHFKGLKKLEVLDLMSNPITDAGVVHLVDLPRLRHLNLAFTKIYRVVHLKKMTQLTRLDLAYVFLIGEGEKELRKALPNTKITGV
jgi:hypothetical protein